MKSFCFLLYSFQISLIITDFSVFRLQSSSTERVRRLRQHSCFDVSVELGALLCGEFDVLYLACWFEKNTSKKVLINIFQPGTLVWTPRAFGLLPPGARLVHRKSVPLGFGISHLVCSSYFNTALFVQDEFTGAMAVVGRASRNLYSCLGSRGHHTLTAKLACACGSRSLNVSASPRAIFSFFLSSQRLVFCLLFPFPSLSRFYFISVFFFNFAFFFLDFFPRLSHCT